MSATTLSNKHSHKQTVETLLLTLVIRVANTLSYRQLTQCTEVHFSSFFSGGFITAIVESPPERELAKRTSVQCSISVKRGGWHKSTSHYCLCEQLSIKSGNYLSTSIKPPDVVGHLGCLIIIVEKPSFCSDFA